jgi:putative hydrolase of the HAD superfamily
VRISFDFWGTLVRSNPQFKIARAQFVNNFVDAELSVELVTELFDNVKKKHNQIIENYGVQPSKEYLFADILNTLGVKTTNSEVSKFCYEYQQLVYENAPLPWEKDTGHWLKMIALQGGCNECNLVSNTLLIQGNTLEEVLKKLGWVNALHFRRYSDHKGLAKPANIFFEKTQYHIGDNPQTDGACVNYGINFYQVNTNNNTLKTFYEDILCSQN